MKNIFSGGNQAMRAGNVESAVTIIRDEFRKIFLIKMAGVSSIEVNGFDPEGNSLVKNIPVDDLGGVFIDIEQDNIPFKVHVD